TPGFGDSLLAALKRIGGAIAGRYVAGEGECFVRAVHTYNRGVGTWPDDGIAHNHVVVLLPDPALGGETWRPHQREQGAGEAIRGRNAVRAHCRRLGPWRNWP